eukprot:1149216-Pelagomonas_calceolata.AAC.2
MFDKERKGSKKGSDLERPLVKHEAKGKVGPADGKGLHGVPTQLALEKARNRANGDMECTNDYGRDLSQVHATQHSCVA